MSVPREDSDWVSGRPGVEAAKLRREAAATLVASTPSPMM
jgi:hypothetical protein